MGKRKLIGKKSAGKNYIPTEDLPAEYKNRLRVTKRKGIDEEKLKRMAATNLSLDIIADAMDCSVEMLQNNYPRLLLEARAKRKITLGETMWDAALLDKDVKMMIWLSKQYLGHREQFPDLAQQINFNVVIDEVPR